MSKNYLQFNRNIAKQKPSDLNDQKDTCPFCNLKNQEDIIDEINNIKLVRNIYPVFDNAFMTVLIEHEGCELNLSTYPDHHRDDVIAFGIRKWKEMLNDLRFKSVIFYKNHGVFSGGSLNHSHMQLVGLYEIDCMENIKPKHFEGLLIHQGIDTKLNVSTTPLIGVHEFNIEVSIDRDSKELSKYIQITTNYILNHLNKAGKSYNLFFYRYEDKIVVKVVSRRITSPYIHGYLLPQVPVDLSHMVSEIQGLYF
jgi:ATP adenylyltransferase/5',5'''-P-1,P-4-tetraphosphate phosphorylase II